MSAAWTKALTDGFKEARRVAGVDFVVSGTTYKGVQSDGTSLSDLTSGGFMADADFVLECLASEVNPSIGTTLTIGGISYRVASKRTSADNPVAALALIGVNK